MSRVTFGGIIKHSDGLGFKITFKDQALAQKYKEAFIWYIQDDNIKVKDNKGYYDTGER